MRHRIHWKAELIISFAWVCLCLITFLSTTVVCCDGGGGGGGSRDRRSAALPTFTSVPTSVNDGCTNDSTTTGDRQITTATTTGTMTKNPQDGNDHYDDDDDDDREDDNPRTRVCIIGSGNWGSAIATVVGRNCARLPFCHTTVNMWVYEEDVTVEETSSSSDGNTASTKTVDKLSSVINARHENVKYLPGIRLPANVRAVPDLAEACRGANVLIFVVPHQFLPDLMPTIRQHVHPTRCRGISLIKGLDFDRDTHTPVLISQSIARGMGPDFRCGVLMGANVADEVAREQFCESTLACEYGDDGIDEETRLIFHDDRTFRVQRCPDVAGAEVCGALKNVVAIGAGFLDGMRCGGNTKAALLRIGILEIMSFARIFFRDRRTVRASTFWQSCGVADLITTCYGGRNRRCAEEFATRCTATTTEEKHDNNYRTKMTTTKVLCPDDCIRLWNDIETELLQGQKLQGTLTAKEVYHVLQGHDLLDAFPLMVTVYQIAFEGRPVHDIVHAIRIPSSRL